MIRKQALGYPQWIEVAGYKSIREPARIEMRPLTLLAGTNSSGKSSIFQPLLLLKQSLEVPYDPDPLLLDGPHLAITSLDQILSRGRSRKTQVDNMHLTFGPMRRVGSRAREVADIEVKLEFLREPKGSERFQSKVSIREEQETAEWLEVCDANRAGLLTMMGMSGRGEVAVVGDGLHARVVYYMRRTDKQDVRPKHLPINEPIEWTRSILHLPGFRGHRERRFPISKVTRSRFGSFTVVGPLPPYAASLLLEWRRAVSETAKKGKRSRERERAQENLKQVNDGMRQLGLTWKVRASAANAAELELRVGRMPGAQQGGANDLVDIADVGFGLSQVLPVLVAVAAAVPNQMVLIEQPELHLHPRAQLAMGRVLADAAKRGVIVVVETHSQLILRAIQTIIAQGHLKPQDVGLNWFSRDPDSGWTTVTQADLRTDGSFGDWPVDFPDVYAMADADFITAVFDNGGLA